MFVFFFVVSLAVVAVSSCSEGITLPFSSVTVSACEVMEETYSPSGFLLFAEQPAMHAAIDTARAKDIIAVVE